MLKLRDITGIFTPKTSIYLAASVCALAIAYVTLRMGYIFGAIFSVLPLIVYFVLYAIKNPYWAYTVLFIANYFIMGLSRYVLSFQAGLILDGLILFNLAVLLIRSCYKDVGWNRARNGLTLAALIWFLYCALELFNPESTPLAWARSVRGIAIYFVCIAVLTPIIFYRYKDLKRILALLSILTLLAVLKAYIQKTFGFDAFESRWLYTGGGMTTHIIRSGTRYFSIYSDAANFGAGMGFAMVVFSIAAIYMKNKWHKYYYLAVAAAATYGMLISGTRSAFIIPMVGYGLYFIISKNVRIAVAGTLLLIGMFAVLKYTHIGHGVAEIRRLRSTFNTNDPSLQVRYRNQKLLAEYMKERPFGGGIGMAGAKAKELYPNTFLSQIPTDSWFVMVWVELGIVGLILHISILLYILGYGCYLVLFRIRDRQLRGVVSALNAGVFGIMVASYGNEIYGQLPTGIIVYMSEAFIFLSLRYDKEIAENRIDEKHDYEVE